MTAQFVVTQAGLAAASVASPTGPHVNITKFRVGSAYNYQPTSSDNALRGATLYEGVVTSYAIYSEDTTQFICELPAEAGPFEYGEIGLYMGETLFALAAFPTRRTKLNVSVNGQPHLVSFRCLIKLGQTPAVFNVTTTTNINLLEVPSFAMVPPPASAPSNVNAIIVHETSIHGESTVLVRHSSNQWTILGDWEYVGDTTTTGLVTGTLPAASGYAFSRSSQLRLALQNTGGVPAGVHTLIQNEDGLIRSAAPGTGWWSPNPAFPSYPIGGKFRVYVTSMPAERQESMEDLPPRYWVEVNNLIGGTSTLSVGFSEYSSGTIEYAGWGQTTLEVPSQGGVTSTHKSALSAQLSKINALTGYEIPNNYGNAGFNAAWNQLTSHHYTQSASYRAYVRSSIGALLRHAYLNRYKRPRSALEWTFAKGMTRTFSATAPWESLSFSIRISPPTGQSSAWHRTFFLSGGYVDFTVRSTGNSFIEWMTQRMFSLLGPIRFSYRSVDAMGPLGLSFKRGDGITASSGVLGYEGLHPSPKRMFYYYMPLLGREVSSFLPGGFGRADEALVVELYAQSYGGANYYDLTFRLHQTSLDFNTATTQPGFQLANTDPIDKARIADFDSTLGGSYLSGEPTFTYPNQRINVYAFLGRPRQTFLTMDYPTVGIMSTATSWGTENTLIGSGDFAGGGSANT